MRLAVVSCSLASVLAVACGDDGGSNQRPDATVVSDSSNPPANCLLPASLGTVTPQIQDAFYAMSAGATTPDNYYMFANLNDDPNPDYLLIDLYEGFGVFENGFPTAPTMITLAGDEAQYSTCGACITGRTDLDDQGEFTGSPYLATAGKLELTSVSPTSFAGKLTNVTLTHVNISDASPYESSVHPDGCTSTIDSLEFSATPEADPTNAARTRLRIRVHAPRHIGQ